MGLQLSGSRTGLLLLCQRPFDPTLSIDPLEEEVGEPARYGSAFHEVEAKLWMGLPEKGPRYEKAIAAASKKWNVQAASHELAGHVRSSHRYLVSWLTQNGWDLKSVKVETSYAIFTGGQKATAMQRLARPIDPPSIEEHRYEGVDPTTELPATLDLECSSVDNKRYLILDHKTGFMTEDHYSGDTFAEPARLPQMKTMGLAAPARYRHVELAINHADRKGLPSILSDRYLPDEAESHRKELSAAMGRIGDGSLRPGKWCNVCPAASTCPAKAADLLGGTAAALIAVGAQKVSAPILNHLTVADRAAKLFELIKQLAKLSDAGLAEIRTLVQNGEVIELSDGRVLELTEEQYENLSKATITRALGKLDGDRLIESLRKKGVIETSVRKRLLPRAS